MDLKNNKKLIKERRQYEQIVVKSKNYDWIRKQAQNNRVSSDAIIGELIKHYKKTKPEGEKSGV